MVSKYIMAIKPQENHSPLMNKDQESMMLKYIMTIKSQRITCTTKHVSSPTMGFISTKIRLFNGINRINSQELCRMVIKFAIMIVNISTHLIALEFQSL